MQVKVVRGVITPSCNPIKAPSNLNGDPGTPGYGPTIEIINVWSPLKNRLGNSVIVDVTHILALDFEEIVLDNH